MEERVKKCQSVTERERSKKNVREKISADTKVSEGVGGGAPGTAEEIPLHLMENTMVRQVVPPQSVEDHEAYIHSADGGKPTLEQVPGRNCGLQREAHQEHVFQQDLWPLGDPCRSSLFLKNSIPWKRPMLEHFLRSCTPWKVPTLEKFMEDHIPWEGPHAGAREQRDEEGIAEIKS